jgi:hypothetical protein
MTRRWSYRTNVSVDMVDELTRTEREQRWLACHKARAEARRERQRRADACCADCGSAGRDDPIEQATYHTLRAREVERDAHLLKAEALETTASRLYTGALIVFVSSLLLLAFSLLALLGDRL